MFDPIKGPSNHYQGPATGLGTEAGDTWHAAVEKINAGFKRVVAAFESTAETTDIDARKRITELESAVTAAQMRDEGLDARLKELLDKVSAPQAPPTPPTPPTGDEPKG